MQGRGRTLRSLVGWAPPTGNGIGDSGQVAEPTLPGEQRRGEGHQVPLFAGNARQPLGLACPQAQLGDAGAGQGRFGNTGEMNGGDINRLIEPPRELEQVDNGLSRRARVAIAASPSARIVRGLGRQFRSKMLDRRRDVLAQIGPGDRSRDRRRSSRTAVAPRRASAAITGGRTR